MKSVQNGPAFNFGPSNHYFYTEQPTTSADGCFPCAATSVSDERLHSNEYENLHANTALVGDSSFLQEDSQHKSDYLENFKDDLTASSFVSPLPRFQFAPLTLPQQLKSRESMTSSSSLVDMQQVTSR